MAGRALATAFVRILPDPAGFGAATKAELEGASAGAASAGAKTGEAFGQAMVGRITKLSRNITIGLAGVAAGLAVNGVRMAAKFQSEMEKISTQAGVAQKDIGSLSSGVLKLAGQVGFSPESLALSLYHVESAFESLGITGPKALALVKIAAKGAAVGGADLESVTNALTAMVASGIPGVSNLSKAMGIMNGIVGVGDMKMSDLAEAFGTGVLASVKGFGVTIKDVGAALATFGDNNIRGARAGTQLRMAIQAIAAPGAKGVKILEGWGLNAATFAKDMQKGGLRFALEQLQKQLEKTGYVGKKQGAILTDLFGKRAGVGIQILLGQLDRFESKFPALDKASGGFESAWQKTQKTVTQQMHQLGGAFDAVEIKIGQKLLPVLIKVFDWMKGHTGIVIGVGGALAGLAVTITAISTAVKAYNAVTLAFTTIQKAATAAALGTRLQLIGLKIAEIAQAAASKIAAAAQWLWNLAMDANPIGIIVIAIAALVGAIIYAYTHFKWFRDFVNGVWRDLKAWTVDTWHVIYGVFKTVFEWIQDHWKLLLVILTGPIGLAVDIIVTQWKHIEAAFRALWHYIWDDFGAKILHFFTQTLPRWFTTATGWVNRNLVQPWIAYQKLLWRYIWTDFGAKIVGFFLHTLPGWFQSAVSWFNRTFITPFVAGFQLIWHYVWTDFGAKIFHFLTSTLTGWFRSAVDGIKRIWHDIEDALKAPVNWVIRFVYDDGIRKMWNFVAKLAGLPSLPEIPQLAEGGKIMRGGGETADDVLVRVSKNETVVSAAHSRLLAPVFEQLGIRGYAKGGKVGDRGAGGSSSSSIFGSILGGLFSGFKIMAALASGNKVALEHAFESLFPSAAGHGAGEMLQLITKLPVTMVVDLVEKAIKTFAAGSNNAIVRFAESFVGKVPYVWGGSTPSGWDCSGMTSWIYDHFGYSSIPRTAAEQQAWATKTNVPIPGGLAFFGGADGSASSAGHVGIIRDARTMINAFGTGFGTIISPFSAGGSFGGFGIPPGGFGHHTGPIALRKFDAGGWLPPGLSLAANGTGRHERVVPPGGDQIVLLVRTSGNPVDDFIAELIKKYVRVVGGGDVQTAFGRSA